MKLQYLAVIFIVIIMPISFVMSQYIQTQISTIVLQSAYMTNLTNATSDALKAFQLNSINNRYSNISDSKIRDIEASINTFYRTLGASMGNYVASEEDLALYIPAMLYTLYDGYYIYSSYNNLYTADANGKVTIDDDVINYQSGLRPYIYYSAKYNLNGNDIIINYTLDNAITIYGNIGDGEGYSTKSGYFINHTLVDDIDINAKTLKYSGVTIGPETLTEHLMIINDDGTVSEGDYNYIIYKNKKVYEDNTNGNVVMEVADIPEYDADGKIIYDYYGRMETKKVNMPRYFWYEENRKVYLESEKMSLLKYLEDNRLASISGANASGIHAATINFKSISAFEYYYNAYYFSRDVVYQYLRNITQESIVQNDGRRGSTDQNGNLYLSVNTGNSRIFDTTNANNDPLQSDSTFNTHRMAVIRKSIETNLTTAIVNYNQQAGVNYEFVMPKIDEEKWNQIVNYVSLTTFMQGLPIGNKIFNNYTVLANTKNEEVISDQAIYILTKEGNNFEYHRPGCEVLCDISKNSPTKIQDIAYEIISMQRQTVKVSDADYRYFYPQVRGNGTNNTTLTGCYHCVVNAAGNYGTDSIIEGEVTKYEVGTVLYNENDLKKLRKVYLTALGRERFDLYKTNFDLNDL